MRRVRDFSLAALVVSCFIQIGAQLFALVVVARTVSAAPPRSLRILSGEYNYDSSMFWQTVPAVTAVLFVVALACNWRTTRRSLLVGAFGLFLLGGVVAGTFLEPKFAELVKIGYQDTIDAGLQSRAANWYAWDWAVWCVGLVAGILLLVAFKQSATSTMPTGRSDEI